MLDHHLQRQIVTRLKSESALSFSELKPDELDNKLFTYHLKIAIQKKFVRKTTDGLYQLTPAGERLWKRMSESPEEIALRAFSVLYIAVHHHKNGWLLYRRNNHPFKDGVGFMHAIPSSNFSSAERCAAELLVKTGLRGSCAVIGSGFFRTVSESSTEGFVNFTLALCEDATGELVSADPDAEYFWSDSISITMPGLLPNMPALLEAISSGQYPFFLDEVVSGG